MRHWGGLNNVVFDAIMKGALPITSDVIGAREAFGTLLPTFHTIEGALYCISSCLMSMHRVITTHA